MTINPYGSMGKTLTPEEQDEADDLIYKSNLDWHKHDGMRFEELPEDAFNAYLRTRKNEFLYDSKVWQFLTGEEQRAREESYEEFYKRIVGHEHKEFIPRVLSLRALLSERRRYKFSLMGVFVRIFRPARYLACKADELGDVIKLYQEFLNIISKSDSEAWKMAYKRWTEKLKDLESAHLNVIQTRIRRKAAEKAEKEKREAEALAERKRREERIQAVIEGRRQMTRSLIADAESWEMYLKGVKTGVAYENAIKKVLCGLGFKCEATKASGDQGVDLILMLKGRKVAIQCKLYGQPVGNTAVQEVFAGKANYGCDEAWVITNASYTIGARRLASKTNVCLLHHSALISKLPLEQ